MHQSILPLLLPIMSFIPRLLWIVCVSYFIFHCQASTRIAIIGASGYVGSYLSEFLLRQGLEVVGFDRDPRHLFASVQKYAAADIPDDILKSFDVVIYMGGLIGRAECSARSVEQVQAENVDDVVHLAKRMQASQLLVFESTGAIAEGLIDARETDAPLVDRLDTYSASLYKRENALRDFSAANRPRIVGLRMATIVGLSPTQSLDFLHLRLVCDAFSVGRLSVVHPESYRGVLGITDLGRAFHILIRNSSLISSPFEIFHLQSFGTTVGAAAAEVAAQTGVRWDIDHDHDHHDLETVSGFTLNSVKFQTHFSFEFRARQNSTVSELISNVPRLCMGTELVHRHGNESIPCVVCGARDMMTVLDLGAQPLANDFSPDPAVALARERYPLKIVKCRQCHHAQLSYLVDRARLFSGDYKYQSGTSATASLHFDFIASKVIKETGRSKGTVVEIASNDGTQLDKFAARGWRTYGVDPAGNLATIAAAKNHTIFTGFWGVDNFKNFPGPEEIDAIVAQNVLAHVEDPVRFTKACAQVMGSKTRLYLQTSQCEMMYSGQFDTAYQEHVSFFSAHSFKKLAELSNLQIVNFELVDIHGRSCLVTMMKHSPTQSRALQHHLGREVLTGITDDWFYLRFRHKAMSLRRWLHERLTYFSDKSYTLVAYGAAAKGMVLLHYLREEPQRRYQFKFVVDDAPLKQNTYCPGTDIIVKPTTELLKVDPARPLVVVILAWNFEHEILDRIAAMLAGSSITKVLAVVPFPTQRILLLSTRETLLTNPVAAPPWPQTQQFSTMCIVPFKDDTLLAYWIRHHVSIFSTCVLINVGSTTKAHVAAAKELPSSWHLVNVPEQGLSAYIETLESQCYTCWKMQLALDEFLLHPRLSLFLTNVDTSYVAVRFPSFVVTGNDSAPLDPHIHLAAQRATVAFDPDIYNTDAFFVHRLPLLRSTQQKQNLPFNWVWASEGVVIKFTWSPWPQKATSKSLEAERGHFLASHNSSRLDVVEVGAHLWAHQAQARQAWYQTMATSVDFIWQQ
jgi:nucleoside-diphosphate-sugar epimerase